MKEIEHQGSHGVGKQRTRKVTSSAMLDTEDYVRFVVDWKIEKGTWAVPRSGELERVNRWLWNLRCTYRRDTNCERARLVRKLSPELDEHMRGLCKSSRAGVAAKEVPVWLGCAWLLSFMMDNMKAPNRAAGGQEARLAMWLKNKCRVGTSRRRRLSAEALDTLAQLEELARRLRSRKEGVAEFARLDLQKGHEHPLVKSIARLAMQCGRTREGLKARMKRLAREGKRFWPSPQEWDSGRLDSVNT